MRWCIDWTWPTIQHCLTLFFVQINRLYIGESKKQERCAGVVVRLHGSIFCWFPFCCIHSHYASLASSIQRPLIYLNFKRFSSISAIVVRRIGSGDFTLQWDQFVQCCGMCTLCHCCKTFEPGIHDFSFSQLPCLSLTFRNYLPSFVLPEDFFEPFLLLDVGWGS